MQNIDSRIPKFSGQLALKQLPRVDYLDLSDLDYQYNEQDATNACTLQYPSRFTGAPGRIQNEEVDMRWTMFQRDDVNGVREHHIGRHYSVSQPKLVWTMKHNTGYMNSRLVPAPAVAQAASELLPKDANSMIQAIKTHFMDSPNRDTSITPQLRAQLRTLMASEFNITPMLWRLATLWYLANWVETTGVELRSFINNADLCPINQMVSLDQFTMAVNRAFDKRESAICVSLPPDAIHMVEMLAVLRFAASTKWATSFTGEVPSVVSELPPLPNAVVYNCGTLNPGETVPGILNSHVVWEAANMYAAQHSCTSGLLSCIKSVGMLWCSPRGDRSSMFLSPKLSLFMPAMVSGPTVLLNMSTNATRFLTDGVELAEPDFATTLLGCVQDSAMFGCCIRMCGMLSGMPVAMYMQRAQNELNAMCRGLARVGDHHSRIMMQAVRLFRELGGGGTLGYILASAAPAFTTTREVVEWWGQHSDAYQWDEVACVMESLPDNSSLCGIFDPLLTTSMAIVNKWYGVTNSIAARCSTPHAMQRLVYKQDVDIGVAVTASVDGSRQIYNYDLHTSYRNQYSDWLFFGPFMRKAAAAELVFRVRSGETALELMHGPVGANSRKYYIGKPDQDDDLDVGLLNDMLDFNLGGGGSGGLPPPPSERPDAPDFNPDFGERQDPVLGGDVRMVSALAGKVPTQPIPPKPSSTGIVGAATKATNKSPSVRDDEEYEEYTPITHAPMAQQKRLPEPWGPTSTMAKARPDPPPQVELLGRASDASSVGSSVKSAQTMTRTEAAIRHKATHVDLGVAMSLQDAKNAFSEVQAEKRRLILGSWYATLMSSGSPTLKEFAIRLPPAYSAKGLSPEGRANAVITALGPLTQTKLSEVLAKVPSASRSSVAAVVCNVAKNLAEIGNESSVQMAVNTAARYANAAYVMSVEPAITPNEVIAYIGMERWKKADTNVARIEEALEDGIAVKDVFPVKYQVKGKDKTREAWDTPAAYGDGAREAIRRRQTLENEVATRHLFWTSKNPQPALAFAADYGIAGVHDLGLLAAVVSTGAADSPSTEMLAAAKATAALAADVAAMTKQQAAAFAQTASVDKQLLPGTTTTLTPAVSVKDAADALPAASVHPDFESPSSDTSTLLGVGTANTGEGAVFGVDMQQLPGGSSSSSAPVPVPTRSVIGRIVSSIPSMDFGRPTSS